MKGQPLFAGFNYDLHDGESQITFTCRYLSLDFYPDCVKAPQTNLVRKLESLLNVVFFYVASCSMGSRYPAIQEKLGHSLGFNFTLHHV